LAGDGELTDAEKLAMFRERVEAYNRDGAVAFENENPDLVMATAAEWPGGGEFRGLGAVMEFLRQFGEAWEEIRLEPGDVSVVAGRLLFPARWVARGASSHIETTVDFYGVTSFQGRRISRMDYFFKEREAGEFVRSARPAEHS